MPNPQNLKNFPPGVSGNPKGRPKGSLNTKTILRKLLSAKIIDEESGKEMTAHELMLIKLLRKACNEVDQKAIDSILDRFEGKPNQSIEVKEKTIDDIESLTEAELKERASSIIKKLNGK